MLAFDFNILSLTCNLNELNFPQRLNCRYFFLFISRKVACIGGECATFRRVANRVLNNLSSNFNAVILHWCNSEYLGRRSTVIWVNSFNWFYSFMVINCLGELRKRGFDVLNFKVMFRLNFLAVSLPNTLIIRNRAFNIQIRHQMINWSKHYLCKHFHLFTIAIVPHNKLLVPSVKELFSDSMQLLVSFLRDCS